MRVSSASGSAQPWSSPQSLIIYHIQPLPELGERWLSLLDMRDFDTCDDDEALARGKAQVFEASPQSWHLPDVQARRLRLSRSLVLIQLHPPRPSSGLLSGSDCSLIVLREL